MKRQIILLCAAMLSLSTTFAQQGGERGSEKPCQGQEQRGGKHGGGQNGGQKGLRVFDLAQTLSYGAQTNTIAFSVLALYTGSLYSSSFYPSGQVVDYLGFQYMRDNDLRESGHNIGFLTKAAWHTMSILTQEQIQIFIDLAVEQ